MKQFNVLWVGMCILVLAAGAFGQETAPPQSQLAVAEAKLGTGVENKAIVGEGSEFTVNDKVYLWVKLTGGPSDSITVTWKHGADSYETKLNVGGSPWRTWSYKTVWKAGEWTVSVTSASGDVLKEMTFMVKEAEPPKPQKP
jgi:hypothetical protein